MNEIYFKLKRPGQKQDFIQVLFRERIPHSSFYKDYFSTQQKFIDVLLKEGIEIEIVTPVNLGELSLEARNTIKENFQKQIALNREKVRECLKNLAGVAE